ncbi:TM2 domain-containing protein [Streptococcus merionis]|uniref:TM2 domain-containing protein n=1 Tax=Streptococcus merionis TaxID=400065 RepID=UPI003516338E
MSNLVLLLTVIVIILLCVFLGKESKKKPIYQVVSTPVAGGVHSQSVSTFLMLNRDKFTNEDYLILQQELAQISPEKEQMLYAVELKNPTTILIVSLLLGGWAVDRFMLGDIGLGILKILTLGGLGIWTIADYFITYKKAKRYNFEQVMYVLAD